MKNLKDFEFTEEGYYWIRLTDEKPKKTVVKTCLAYVLKPDYRNHLTRDYSQTEEYREYYISLMRQAGLFSSNPVSLLKKKYTTIEVDGPIKCPWPIDLKSF